MRRLLTEQERIAYAMGDKDRADLLARIADLERMVDELTDQLIDLRACLNIERVEL